MELFGQIVIVGAIVYGIVFLVLALFGVKVSKRIVLFRRILLIVFVILLLVVLIIRPFSDTCPLESADETSPFYSVQSS
ncbi:MAG: hypothetical protein GX099_05830 [Clostridiaceae bacterium]|jgi:uncharacterized PurR-regulated membrane protein YhhQ (DUF165 family)|nr:hypothetical protein [Oscillospiraceae bacterium]NLO62931.1 hypothetical protein [Clostridiaceae bacterium]